MQAERSIHTAMPLYRVLDLSEAASVIHREISELYIYNVNSIVASKGNPILHSLRVSLWGADRDQSPIMSKIQLRSGNLVISGDLIMLLKQVGLTVYHRSV